MTRHDRRQLKHLIFSIHRGKEQADPLKEGRRKHVRRTRMKPVGSVTNLLIPRKRALVNNAGVGIFKPVDQLTAEEWDATIQTNLSSVFYCCHEAVPVMRQHGGGHIFNISSLLAVHGIAGGSAYCASKFGVNGFAEAVMQDVRYDSVRVSTIMPGSVATDFGGSAGSNRHEWWKLSGKDIAQAVIDIYRYPGVALLSRIEIRPSQHPRKA